MHVSAGRLARSSTLVGLLSGMTISLSVASAQPPAKAKAVVETRAVDALRGMGIYLRTLKEFGVVAEASRDEVMKNGQKVQIGGTVSYYVRTPDRLRVDIQTDRKQRQVFYDGKTLTVYAPRMKYYATVNAPPTIAATLDSAQHKYGIEMPIVDLFRWGTPDDGVSKLTSAMYIGPAYINGVDADQYAFRQPGVDWQLWIKRGNAPLPLKLVITTVSAPSQPQYAATLSWDVTARLSDAIFAFVPPRDASKIQIVGQSTLVAKR
jgi:hypothetical protein